ncbi:MAG TPA: protease pro-enzyme activation domain-containing protein [Solirubrobacteraceae bacterium]|jgi:subtilase family serine protease
MRAGKAFSARRGMAVGALIPVVALLAFVLAPSSGASTRTTLIGGVPAISAGAHDSGRLSAHKRLSLTVVLRPRDADALHSFALAVSTPGSPLYRHYLGVHAFATRFGAAPGSLALVRHTLRRDGLHVGAVARNDLSLSVSGTVTRVSRAFGVRLERFREASGRQVFANVSPPRLPAALGGAVAGVLGLDDLTAVAPAGLSAVAPKASFHAPEARPAAAAGAPAACPAAATSAAGTHSYTIDQIAHAYGIDGLYAQGDTGAGVTVALVEAESYANLASDIGAYSQCFFGNLSASISREPVDGGANSGNGEETSVDIENTLGVAPGASIIVYQGPSSEQGIYLTLAQTVEDHRAQVIQDAWSECEGMRDAPGNAPLNLISNENALLEEAASQGQTFLTSSGDRGSEGCQVINNPNQIWGASPTATELAVDDPASQPFATGVGGTELTATGPAPTEAVWNQFGWGSGGGGISNVWPMQPYQASYGTPGVINSYSSGTPCGLSSGDCREVPDVSASASTRDGYIIYYTSEGSPGGWTAVGGTSTSTPVWAGLVALADASTANGCSVSAPLGFLNPDLYEVAAGPNATYAFNDVTSGDNNPQVTGAYPATGGYDMATGLGSPIASDGAHPGLVAQLCEAGSSVNVGAPTLTGMSSTEAAAGATVTLTGTGFTPFSRVLFGSVPAASVNYVSSTQLSVVVPAGSGVVTVTVTTIAGTAGTSPTPANTFSYAPSATITAPAPGSAYTQNQPIAAVYSCSASAPPAPTCSGTVPNGGLINTSALGTHQFTVSAADANVTTTTTSSYTVVAPPAVAISGPSPNATYTQGQVLTASFSCLTSTPVTIASCAAPVSEGAAVDTQTLGSHNFTVVATDSNGVTTKQTVSYVVVSAPHTTVTTPANGAVFVRGSSVTASYLCTAAAPATILSCGANTVSGGKVDTSTIGSHQFTATASDSNGVRASASATYAVVAVRPQVSALHQGSTRWATHKVKGVRLPVGTTFSFTLDQAAKVTLRFARQGNGRMKAGHCVALAKAPKGARTCRLSLDNGNVSVGGQHGVNVVTFTGSTSSGKLPPGNYTVTLTAVGLSGKPSPPASAHFTIVAGG